MLSKSELRKNFIVFNIGMLISSIGTMTFLVSSMASLNQTGKNIAEIGIFVGTFRLVPAIVSIIFTNLFLKLSKVKYYIPLEILSFILSMILAFYVRETHFNVIIFTTIAVARAILSLPQRGNRPYIMKFLEEKMNMAHQRPILWLNKVTHGATFFAAILSALGITYLSLSTIIIIDGITYLASALLSIGVIKLIKEYEQQNLEEKSQDQVGQLWQGSKLLIQRLPLITFLDFILATVLIGANIFSVRVAGNQAILIPLLLMSYGLSVWVGGFLIRIKNFEKYNFLFWPLMAIGFYFVSLHPGEGALTWSLTFLSDLGYWIIFHYITETIQNKYPLSQIDVVHYARNSLMMMYLALGEYGVGFWSAHLSLSTEGLIRALICFAGFVLSWKIYATENTKTI